MSKWRTLTGRAIVVLSPSDPFARLESACLPYTMQVSHNGMHGNEIVLPLEKAIGRLLVPPIEMRSSIKQG